MYVLCLYITSQWYSQKKFLTEAKVISRRRSRVLLRGCTLVEWLGAKYEVFCYLGESGGMLPQKILKNNSSEIEFGGNFYWNLQKFIAMIATVAGSRSTMEVYKNRGDCSIRGSQSFHRSSNH